MKNVTCQHNFEGYNASSTGVFAGWYYCIEEDAIRGDRAGAMLGARNGYGLWGEGEPGDWRVAPTGSQ